MFQNNPNANIGLLLGDIVDVEGDTPEANQRINKLIGDCKHPIYRSDKSEHHLFANPFPTLTRSAFDGIEFRANRHQSVLPPSRHPSGCLYQWIVEPTGDLPLLPDDLSDLLLQHLGSQPVPNRPNRANSWARCKKCNKKVFLSKKRLDLELKAFQAAGLTWMCNSCRPRIDVRRKQSKAIYSPDIDCMRQLKLNKNLLGELEFKTMLDDLQVQYGKLFNYKQHRAFIVPDSKPLQFFFHDFFIYNFPVSVELLRDEKPVPKDEWRMAYLRKHNIKVFMCPAKDVLLTPDVVRDNFLWVCSMVKSSGGRHLKKLLQGEDYYCR